MPTIAVHAIVGDGEQLLLVRTRGQRHWSLPGGLLTEDDDSVEDAVGRELAAIGYMVMDIDFLDTVHEAVGPDAYLHNVFAVGAMGAPTSEDGAMEFFWADIEALEEMPLVDWLAGALPALLAGESLEPEGEALPDFGFALQGAWTPEEPAAVAPSGRVLILRGPAGAGKTTIARAWCARLPKAAHIDGDRLRDLVVSGAASPLPGESDPEQARLQLDLLARNAAALAWNFIMAGFDVVIDEVVERPDEVDGYVEYLDGADLAIVTLLPDAATLRARDQGRAPAEQMGDRTEDLRRIFAAQSERRGLWLDTSTMTVDETVEAIIERMSEARLTPDHAWA